MGQTLPRPWDREGHWKLHERSDWTARAIRGKNVAISGEAQTPLLEPV